jgi:DUF1009 family protein
MNEPAPNSMEGEAPVAIVCGGGSVPFAVADAVSRRGRRAILFPIRGWADPKAVERYPHRWIALGQLGRAMRAMQEAGCREVVFIGKVMRPPLRELRFDWETVRMLPRVVRAFRGGDDHLLSRLGGYVKERGFELVGAHELAPEILLGVGLLGSHAPSARDLADIGRGLAVLHALSPFDIGQAVVIANNHVLAVEAAEGTDEMLGRIAEQRRLGRIPSAKGVGVLVKAPKAGQDRRFDLPSIGPQTVERVARAGLAGIAVLAGSAIVAEAPLVAALADREHLFVTGVAGGGTQP